MKLMALPPESQRLRRIARAHAAGEFSRSEYRQARRVLLEELVSVGGSVLEDTFRRTADTARRDQHQTLEVAFAGVGAPVARRSLEILRRLYRRVGPRRPSCRGGGRGGDARVRAAERGRERSGPCGEAPDRPPDGRRCRYKP